MIFGRHPINAPSAAGEETQNGSSVISLDRIQRLRAVEGAAAACTISKKRKTGQV